MKIAGKLILLGSSLAFTPSVSKADEPAAYILGAVGDSITAGFDARRFGDNKELSWSSGQDAQGLVQSHARRIEAILGRPVTAFNEAFVGAQAADLPRQIGRLVRHKPDYVTLAIGANDVCVWGDDYLAALEAYRTNVATGIQTLIDANPHVKIVMIPVPDIIRVREVGLAHSCQDRWDTINVCRPLLAPGVTADNVAHVANRLRHINTTMAEIAQNFPDHVHFRGEIASYVFEWPDLSSLDCFHPSIIGHNKLAEFSFDPSWN